MRIKICITIAVLTLCLSAFADGYVAPSQDVILHKINKHSTSQKQLLVELQNTNTLLSKIQDNTDPAINIIEEKGCNDWWGNIIGSALGAIISAIVSLCIYRQGKKDEDKRRKKAILDFGEVIYLLTDKSVKNSTISIKEIENYISLVKREKYKWHNLNRITTTQLHRIKSFRPEEIKNVFRMLKVSNKDFANFYEGIDYLAEEYANIYRDYDNIVKNCITPRSNKFLVMCEDIRNEIVKYTEQLRVAGSADEKIWQYLNNLICTYHQQRPEVSDIKYDYDNLVYKLLIAAVGDYRHNDFMCSIVGKLSDAKPLYHDVVNANLDFIATLETSVVSSLERATNSLSTIRDNLAKHYPANTSL
ncbi:hypothetical protein FACS189456_6150 [Bacteroidia bacterium]|nr:hypothetical protein FACS189456_6150 [Bacteroidia bacterium]